MNLKAYTNSDQISNALRVNRIVDTVTQVALILSANVRIKPFVGSQREQILNRGIDPHRGNGSFCRSAVVFYTQPEWCEAASKNHPRQTGWKTDR